MKSSIGYNFGSNLANDIKLRSPEVNFLLEFGGINVDIAPAYFWITQFRNYTNKGYNFIKIEDVHHFSETSQFGGNLRQIKGGGIRAFQENLNQVIQLIKVHLMPLLKEIKQAHMYKIWFDKIIENDEYLSQILDEKKGKSGDKLKELEKKEKEFRRERNEAINHLKNKWVSEVDGGKLFQISRSSQEQGLDMTLLPQLFFGTYLDDPFQRNETLTQQLDESTYKVDITKDAQTQVANFQYRFYTWLPTAIRDTQTTFNIKIASLRQFYSQIEMHMQFMKPLLMEISKKSEKMHSNNFFKGYGDEDPTMVKLFDTTLSFTRVYGPNKIVRSYQIQDLEFTKFGLIVPQKELIKDCGINSNVIVFKVENGEEISNKPTQNYYIKEFSGTQNELNQMSKIEFEKLETKILPHYYFKPTPTPELTFTQQRRQEMVNTGQGMQQVPFMENSITFLGQVWNFIEIAAHRQKVRSDDIHLLESFIQELGAVKEELLTYLNYQEGDDISEFGIDFSRFRDKKNSENNNKKSNNKSTNSIPIFGEIINLFYKSGTVKPADDSKVAHNSKVKTNYIKEFEAAENKVIEEVFKSYNIYKKVGGFVGW